MSANKRLSNRRLQQAIAAVIIVSNGLLSLGWDSRVEATSTGYCQLSADEIAGKEQLRQAALKGNTDAGKSYTALLLKHADWLRRCRSQSWPPEQAIWLRMYPCDVRSGAIDEVMDRIVSRGYNTVYVETFADSQVLLPPADNPTPWDSIVRTPGAENTDLLAQAIQKGRQRGIKVYAWLFTMNFGYAYAQRSDRASILARNGAGQDSTAVVHDQSQAFIDPYHPQAQTDYTQLVQAVLRRRPDGVLFDYVRYPRGTGTQSAVGNVKDLWIYGAASRQALLNRGTNQKGRALIERYLTQGYITTNDVLAIDKLYPQEGPPLWQGRKPPATEMKEPIQTRYGRIKADIWHLSVAHAAQGVIDFLARAATMVQSQGIPAGAVFFPDGNQSVGNRGYDSRLQAWDKFPPSLEWHPMSYGVCNNTSCIVQQVKRVTGMAPTGVQIVPALAGLWGKPYDNRPALETQMEAIRAAAPQIRSISHFAFSWQEPEYDRERRFCKSFE